MLKNMQKEIRTQAYVLRRTNYGEADRILNIITPGGKISAIAKGARKEKSKLAGGIEMFSLIEITVHHSKSDFGIVTSAKMLKYYDKILMTYEKMELATMLLKEINKVAENSDSAEYFKLIDQGLDSINNGINTALVESWFLLNLMKAQGEDMNLYRDVNGNKLMEESRYDWDALEKAFAVRDKGEFGAREIKTLRLMTKLDIATVGKIKNIDEMLMRILRLMRVTSGH